MKISELAKNLKPYVVKWINEISGSGVTSSSITSSGTGAPTDATYVLVSLNAGLSAERILTGTSNQIALADGGANGNIVLSTPQDIATNSNVQFNRVVTNELSSVTLIGEMDADGSNISNVNVFDASTANITTINPTTINAFALGGNITGANNNITGINVFGATTATITTINPTTINAFALGGNITGASNNITGLGQLTVDNVRVDGNTVDTTSGDLILDSTGGEVSINDFVDVTVTSEQLRLSYDGSNYSSFTVGSGGNLTIAPTGDLIFNPTGNDIMPTTGYDLNLGSISKKYLTLHAAELWVETLVAQNTIATIGGRILVGPTTMFEADLSSLSGATVDVTVKHNQMSRQDIVYSEANGSVEFFRPDGLAITGVNTTTEIFQISGNKTSTFANGVYFTVVGSQGNDGEWTVSSSSYLGGTTSIIVTGDITNPTADGYILYTGQQGVGPFVYLDTARNLDGSGQNSWYSGDALFNTGNSGDGFIDLYSLSGVISNGVGPTIVGNTRNSTTYNDWTEAWAIGNLNGVYGYGSDTYGVAFGKYSSADYLTIDASNGIRFFDSGDVVRAQLSSGTWTLGNTAGGEYVNITSSAIEMYGNSVKVIDLDSSGNATFGEVATDQGNAYWNNGNSRLEFRGGTNGTVVEAYVDTDGSIIAGGGDVVINSDGINIASGTATSDKMRWMSGSDQVLEVYANFTGGGGTDVLINAIGVSGSNDDAQIVIDATDSTNDRRSQLSIDTSTPETSMFAGNAAGSSGVTFSVNDSTNRATLSGGDFRISDAYKIYINESVNTDQTVGITINQGANDDEIISLKSSDVNHGITDVTEYDTYGFLKKHNLANGGVRLAGLSEDEIGVSLVSYYTNDDTGKSTGVHGSIVFNSMKKNGSGTTSPGANANIFAVKGNGSTRFIVDAEGDIHMDATSNANAWDEHNDIALLTGLRASVMPEEAALRQEFSEWMEYSRPILEKTGVITYNDDGHHFVSMKKLQMLQIDAMRQMYDEIQHLKKQLEVKQ